MVTKPVSQHITTRHSLTPPNSRRCCPPKDPPRPFAVEGKHHVCVCVSRAHRRRRPRPRRLEYPSPRPLSIPPHSHPPGLCDLVGILGDALHRVGDPIARRLGEVVPVSVPRRVPVRTFGVGGWDGSTRWTGVLKETKDPRDPRDLRDPRGLSLCVACLGWWSRNPPPKSRPSHRGEARPGFGGPYR